MGGKVKKFNIKNRVLLFMGLFVLVFVIIIGRLAWLQIVSGSALKKSALEDQTREQTINAQRGNILDRNGRQLAVSIDVDTVVADPSVVQKEGNVDREAGVLAELLGMDKQVIIEKLSKNNRYEIIKKAIDPQVSTTIRKYVTGKDADGKRISEEEFKQKQLTGVFLKPDTKRYYPMGSLASHVIGFTGTDNNGLEGIEAIYEKYLKGTNGKIVSSGMAKSNSLEYEKFYSAKDGYNITLTIDETIQHFLEKYLSEARIEHNAKSACAIVIDPNNGEVLGMATNPTFDLNDPRAISDTMKQYLATLGAEQANNETSTYLKQLWRNKPVVDTYEPGSTFKIVTAAMALENKSADLGGSYFCPGYHVVAGIPIKCWKTTGHGSETFLQGLVASCNPVLMQVGEKIGKEDFYKYFRLFGFRETSGFDMPGEASGVFHSYENFNTVELATASFGQGLTVTPLQMVTAVSSLVNGGTMYKPHIVKQIVDKDGNVAMDIGPQVIKQTVSKATSDQIKYVLETVIKDSGSLAAVKGYRIGGKSGTSEKLPRGSGKYIASFIAAAPIDDPKFIVLFIVDEPQGVYYGGQIAAPMVGKISEEILRYMGYEPQYTEQDLKTMNTTIPDVKGKTIEEARAALVAARLGVKVVGSGNVVTAMAPEPGTVTKEYSTIVLYTEGASSEANLVSVPDLKGKTIMECNQILAGLGLNINISTGSTSGGKAITQNPQYGAKVPIGSVVEVTFAKTN